MFRNIVLLTAGLNIIYSG